MIGPDGAFRLPDPTPPLGAWRFLDPRWHGVARCWHVACPACRRGRVLLLPVEGDPYEFQMRPHTCTLGCLPAEVVWWFAVVVGDMALFHDWLRRQRARDEKAWAELRERNRHRRRPR